MTFHTTTGPKPLRIRFDKIDGFIRVCVDEFRHLVFLYLISGKSWNADGINHNFGEMRTDSYNYL